MGGGSATYTDYSSGADFPESEPEPEPLLSECSIKALSSLTRKKERDVVEVLRTGGLLSYFTSDGISSLNLKKAINAFSGDKRREFDLRLIDNPYRINTEYIPFSDGVEGIVALKNKKNNTTHWVCYEFKKFNIDGLVASSMEELKIIYPEFDGFGHCVLYYSDPEAAKVKLQSIYSVRCQSQTCVDCIRESFCFEKVRPPEKLKGYKPPKRRLDV